MRVRISPDRLEAPPGIPASFEAAAYTTGDVIEGFRVTLAGLDRPVELLSSPSELSLFPATEGTATVTFTLPRDFPAGAHTARVEVTGTTDPLATAAVPLALLVAPVYDAGLSLEPQSVTAGRRARVTVVGQDP